MSVINNKLKVEYGDFQTPIELAKRICQKLSSLGVNPDLIVEPTCGVGNFIVASIKQFNLAANIVGIEINPDYIKAAKNSPIIKHDERVIIHHGDLLNFPLSNLEQSGEILVIGNFPWITNSQQGLISGKNLPQKSNFLGYKGLDALTGKSNFDLSEWMLIQIIEWLQNYEHSYLGMVCKTSVARKILHYLRDRQKNVCQFSTYGIDAKKYFKAAVESCLLFCEFRGKFKRYFCDVFPSMESADFQRIGFSHNRLIADMVTFQKLSFLYSETQPLIKWRSGIKHDCAKIMELRQVNDDLVNGLGEKVNLEDDYIFPLLKGSDIANGKISQTDKYVLVTQKSLGEDTTLIQNHAPQTWNYLEQNAANLDGRQSKIYQNHPRFSIFGVGDYTFKPWKIAICGLYKKLEFRLISPLKGKPVLFDDTVYFLGFDTEPEAIAIFEIITSAEAIAFYNSLIFWDEKRPIKTSILNCLNLHPRLIPPRNPVSVSNGVSFPPPCR
ncbi:SAM-dependent methyltransferase [Arthrospira sp. O9.13F]|nr:SAM-dependent methyltransferase [Arthrospira sp. O9.13F]